MRIMWCPNGTLDYCTDLYIIYAGEGQASHHQNSSRQGPLSAHKPLLLRRLPRLFSNRSTPQGAFSASWNLGVGNWGLLLRPHFSSIEPNPHCNSFWILSLLLRFSRYLLATTPRLGYMYDTMICAVCLSSLSCRPAFLCSASSSLEFGLSPSLLCLKALKTCKNIFLSFCLLHWCWLIPSSCTSMVIAFIILFSC